MFKKRTIPVLNRKPASTRKLLPGTPSKPKPSLPTMLKKPAIPTKPKSPPPAMLQKPTISTPNPKPGNAPKTLPVTPTRPNPPSYTMLKKPTVSTPNPIPASTQKTLPTTPIKPKSPPPAMLQKPTISTPNPKPGNAPKTLPVTPTRPNPPSYTMLKKPTVSTPNPIPASTQKTLPTTPIKPKPPQPAMLKKPTISTPNPKPASAPKTIPATTKPKPPQPAMSKKPAISTPNPQLANVPKALPAISNKPVPPVLAPVKTSTVSAPNPKAANNPGKLPATPIEPASRASKPDMKTVTPSGAPIGKPTPKSSIPSTTANGRALADRNIPTEPITDNPPNSSVKRSTEVTAQPRLRSVKPVTRSQQHLTPAGNDFQDDLQQEPRKDEVRSFLLPPIPADTEANSTANDSYLWNTFPPPPPKFVDESPVENVQSTDLTRRRFPEAWSPGTHFVRPPHFGVDQNGQKGGLAAQPTHPEASSYQSVPIYSETTYTESTSAPLPAYPANRAEIESDFTPSPITYSPQYRLKKGPISTIAATFSGPYSIRHSDSGIESSQEQPQNSVSSGKDQSEERSENLDTEEYPTEEQENATEEHEYATEEQVYADEEQEYATEEQELSEEHQHDLASHEDEVSAEETEAENPAVEDDENQNYDENLAVNIPKPTTQSTSFFADFTSNVRKTAREFWNTIACGRKEEEYDYVAVHL